MNSLFKIREYADGNENHIVALFEKVYGKTMGKTESKQHWQWEYLKNPVHSISIKLAWNNGNLIGQYSANPLVVWANGQEVMAALSLDTMTDPDYSGMGVFSETAKSLYNDLVEKKFAFIYGFPNSKSISVFLKYLGWQIISPPPILVCPLDMGPFIRKKTKSDFLGNLVSKVSKPLLQICHNKSLRDNNNHIEIRREKQFGLWADDLWLRCRNQHKIWIVRNYKYLSWRYDMRPESQYNIFSAWANNEIAGFVITTSQRRDEGNVCFILDILVDSELSGVIEKLLVTVKKQSIDNNDTLISSMVMPASIYRKYFHKFCFVSLPHKFFPQELNFGGRTLDNQISNEVFFNSASWYISWGDTDLL